MLISSKRKDLRGAMIRSCLCCGAPAVLWTLVANGPAAGQSYVSFTLGNGWYMNVSAINSGGVVTGTAGGGDFFEGVVLATDVRITTLLREVARDLRFGVRHGPSLSRNRRAAQVPDVIKSMRRQQPRVAGLSRGRRRPDAWQKHVHQAPVSAMLWTHKRGRSRLTS